MTNRATATAYAVELCLSSLAAAYIHPNLLSSPRSRGPQSSGHSLIGGEEEEGGRPGLGGGGQGGGDNRRDGWNGIGLE